jgi:hypothetical protein
MHHVAGQRKKRTHNKTPSAAVCRLHYSLPPFPLARLSYYFSIIINNTKIIISTIIVVTCIFPFAFLATFPKLFLA